MLVTLNRDVTALICVRLFLYLWFLRKELQEFDMPLRVNKIKNKKTITKTKKQTNEKQNETCK